MLSIRFLSVSRRAARLETIRFWTRARRKLAYRQLGSRKVLFVQLSPALSCVAGHGVVELPFLRREFDPDWVRVPLPKFLHQLSRCILFEDGLLATTNHHHFDALPGIRPIQV